MKREGAVGSSDPGSVQDGAHVAHRPERALQRARDLGTPDPRAVRHVDLADAPAGLRRQHDHLEGPAEAPVDEPQLEQGFAPGGAHGAQVAQLEPERAAETSRQVAVGESCVSGPRAALGEARSQHQVGPLEADGVGHAQQVGGVEGAVGVHEAHDVVGGGPQTRPAGGTEAALGLGDHERPELSGDPARAVGAAVVDHDRPEAGGHRLEQVGEGRGFVEHGEHDVGHGRRRYRPPREANGVAVSSSARVRARALVVATTGCAAVFVLAAVVGTRVLERRTLIDAPPFFGDWRWHLGPGVLVPACVAGTVIVLTRHTHRVGWRTFLLAAVVAALAWSAGLAVADHVGRLTAQIHATSDYLPGLRPIGDHPGHYLATFNHQARGRSAVVIARGYPVHVQGHPPGAVLTLWGLVRLGFSGVSGGLALELLGQAGVVVGVLVSARRLASEDVARAVAPFVVLLPGAVWSHNYDAFFAGVAALAVMACVLALCPPPTRPHRRWRWAVLGGVLFGYVALLSYGLVLLALIPVLVAYRVRRVKPLFVVGVVAVGVAALPALWGFSWFSGLATTRLQYVTTIASIRPYGYFVWGDLVVAVVALGPAVVAGLLLASRPGTAPRWHGLAPLVLGSLVALLVADISGMAKSEVERIFQPFLPWLALAAVAMAEPVPDRADRPVRDRVQTSALVLQASLAVVLATQLATPW